MDTDDIETCEPPVSGNSSRSTNRGIQGSRGRPDDDRVNRDPLAQMLMTVPEVAAVLRTSSKAIYSMIDRGQLPGVIRIGRRRILVKRRDLLAFLDRNSTPSSQENRRWP